MPTVLQDLSYIRSAYSVQEQDSTAAGEVSLYLGECETEVGRSPTSKVQRGTTESQSHSVTRAVLGK